MVEGKSYQWLEKYLKPYTSVFGFLVCHVTSKTLGIGPCEHNRASVKNIKTGKQVNLSGELLEKRSVLYASALINDARLTKKED